MAEILKTFAFRGRGGGVTGAYPWAEWFDGKIRRLTRGKDFTVSVTSLRTIAWLAARRHGVTVRVNDEGGKSAVIQATRNGVNGKRK